MVGRVVYNLADSVLYTPEQMKHIIFMVFDIRCSILWTCPFLFVDSSRSCKSEFCVVNCSVVIPVNMTNTVNPRIAPLEKPGRIGPNTRTGNC